MWLTSRNKKRATVPVAETGASVCVISDKPLVRTTMRSRDAVDDLWSWVVCFGSFLVGLLCFGVINNYGNLHIYIIEHFNASNLESGKFVLLIQSRW